MTHGLFGRVRELIMHAKIVSFSIAAWLLGTAASFGALFGIVSGIVEDPQHRPVPQADVTLRARLSSWQEHAQSDAEGKFSFPTVPAGEYLISAAKQGFQTVDQSIVVRSGTVTSLTMPLRV